MAVVKRKAKAVVKRGVKKLPDVDPKIDGSYISLKSVWENLANPKVPYSVFLKRLSSGWALRKSLTTAPADKENQSGRREVTTALTNASIGYLVKKGYGAYRELAIQSWGSRRADVIGVNLYGYMVMCEIKSCLADYRADKKYHEYLPYCNKMYVVFPHTMTVTKDIVDTMKSHGIGIMVLEKDGLVRVRTRAKHREMDPEVKSAMTHRMVWRSSILSRRTTKRMRQYLK